MAEVVPEGYAPAALESFCDELVQRLRQSQCPGEKVSPEHATYHLAGDKVTPVFGVKCAASRKFELSNYNDLHERAARR